MSVIIGGIATQLAWGQVGRSPDLTDASLEQLMNIQVTSVSKKGQRLSKTAASVFVITAEDIRRSGLHSLPELLRLAPGVQVARSSAGSWAISIRGFNDEYANKLLVLVDGRSIYSELFSGVSWDTNEMAIDNIDRIEIIRGPVAAIWGTNAVNGVINILTKTADATQGGAVTMEGGSAGEIRGTARYGGPIGSKASYRVSLRGSSTDQFNALDGPSPSHGWMNRGIDFRVDWAPTSKDKLTFTGDASESSVGHNFIVPDLNNPTAPPVDSKATNIGGNLLARWEHSISDTSTVEGQISWEQVRSSDIQVPLSFNVLDVELKHHLAVGSRNDLIWGINGRIATYHTTPTPTYVFRPPDTAEVNYAIFAEDQIAIVPDKLEFIAGVHAGHNSFTGFEVQPTARLLWTPNARTTSWVAVSRAVRTPSLYQRDLDAIAFVIPIQPGVFAFVHSVGNKASRSEAVIAYESGQRVELTPRLSLDVSAYYNVYQRLQSAEIGTPSVVLPTATSPYYLQIPTTAGNQRYGESYGGELSATWTANRRWKLTGGYDTIFIHTRPYGAGQSIDTFRVEQTTPRNQFVVRSNFDVTRKIQLDTSLFFNGALLVGQSIAPTPLPIPKILRGDIRLGWRPTERLEISAGVQDVFDAQHLEFLSSRFPQPLEVRRNVYGAVRWQF
jgi:iron complex outermembrane receptor protein